jgi:hypothetical protein
VAVHDVLKRHQITDAAELEKRLTTLAPNRCSADWHSGYVEGMTKTLQDAGALGEHATSRLNDIQRDVKGGHEILTCQINDLFRLTASIDKHLHEVPERRRKRQARK